MRMRILLLSALFTAAVMPMLAAGAARCELGGIWYGGSTVEAPYMAVFTPYGADRYTVSFQNPLDLSMYYDSWTAWAGEAIRTGPATFDVYAMQYGDWSAAAAAAYGVSGAIPSLDAVHSVIEISSDCQTLTNTIDLYEGWLEMTFDTLPFVSEPDYEYLQGTTLVEEYRRMPTPCCGPLHAYPKNGFAPQRKGQFGRMR